MLVYKYFSYLSTDFISELPGRKLDVQQKKVNEITVGFADLTNCVDVI